jgi:8-oxo-dGTP pyrophosphatase MutT (NUDIX family)
VRQSNIAYVLIRLPTSDGPALLLRRHEKWGDWSLVGGHVEEGELDDWGLAAKREASEELEPLVAGQDFVVTPIHEEPITWGPEPSRSARGERTVYRIQYYALAFLHDPVALLGRLPAAEFLLVLEGQLGSTPHALGSPVHRARRYLQGGLEAVPRAWPEDLDRRALPAGLRHLTQDPEPEPLP